MPFAGTGIVDDLHIRARLGRISKCSERRPIVEFVDCGAKSKRFALGLPDISEHGLFETAASCCWIFGVVRTDQSLLMEVWIISFDLIPNR